MSAEFFFLVIIGMACTTILLCPLMSPLAEHFDRWLERRRDKWK
jgi:hypothetical protein